MGIKINVIQDKRKTSNNLWYGKALMMQTLDSRASGHSLAVPMAEIPTVPTADTHS